MLGTRAIGLSAEHRAHERDDVVGRDLLLVREPRPLGHPRRDESGRDRRRADAVLGLLAVQRVRPRDERRLRRAVDGEPRCRDRPGDRRERDDLSAGRAQMRQRLARDHERRAEVDVELEVDLLRVLLGERPADADAGGVHEDVHPAVALGVGRDDADALVGVARGWRGRRSAPSSAAASSSGSGRRATSVSSYPSSRSARAIASPIPDDPPVTSADVTRASLGVDAGVAQHRGRRAIHSPVGQSG